MIPISPTYKFHLFKLLHQKKKGGGVRLTEKDVIKLAAFSNGTKWDMGS
jgi:hypothetical protein